MKSKEITEKINISERRDVAMILSAVLFGINFLCFYFIWFYIFPEITGILRIVMCWVGAYALTWIMTLLSKGVARLMLTLIMLGVYYLIFHYKP